MNRDQIKGKIDEIKGNAKKRIGGASDDTGTQTEGWLEEKKGKVQKGFGDIREDAKRDDPDNL